MSMTYADHVYDNGWEKCADDTGKIDYEKLCKVYHDAFESFESDMEAKLQQQAEKIEELEQKYQTQKSFSSQLKGIKDAQLDKITELEKEHKILSGMVKVMNTSLNNAGDTIQQLETRLKEAESVIKFYAKDAFRELSYNSGYCVSIVESDTEDILGNLYAGKLARQYMEKVK